MPYSESRIDLTMTSISRFRMRRYPRLRALLSTRGFREQHRDDTWECNFVRADEAGRRLDVHSYTLDAAGLNVGGVPCSGEHLTGSGVIGGHPVRGAFPQSGS